MWVYIFLASCIFAMDFRETHPKAWESSDINEAALNLYGKEKFSKLEKSNKIDLYLAKGLVRDPKQVTIQISSKIKAKSLALFYDKNPQTIIAVFDTRGEEVLEYEINIAVETRGTLLAVIEDIHGNLYYTRAFIDVLCLPCLAK